MARRATPRPSIVGRYLVHSIFLVAIFVLGGLEYWREMSQLERGIKSQEEIRIVEAAVRLRNKIDRVADDLQELSQGFKLRAFLDTSSVSDLRPAIDDAVLYSELNPDFSAIRYVGSDGLELFCVRQIGALVPEDELADFSTEAFFLESGDQSEEVLYLWGLEPDLGNDSALLRGSMPVFGDDGAIHGVYAIDFRVRSVLADPASKSRAGRLGFVNSDGYWLGRIEENAESGVAAPAQTEMSLSRSNPRLWQLLETESNGQEFHEGGLVSWLRLDIARSLNTVLEDVQAEDLYFVVVSDLSADEYNAFLAWPRVRFVVLFSIILVLGIIVSRLGESRRRAVDQLRQNEERLSITLNSIGDGVLTTDMEGNVTSLNPAAERLTGWTASEAEGLPVWEVFRAVHAETRDPVEDSVEVVRRTGEVHADAAPVVLIARDGTESVVSNNAAPLHDSNKRLQGAALVMRDITFEHAAAEERDNMFSVTVDLLCIAGVDGYFKRVNPAFTRTLGWEADELLSRPYLDFVHPDDRDITRAEAERQATSGAPVLRFENRYLHKDGSIRVLSWKAVTQPNGLIYATARDITDARKEAEARYFLASIIECSDDAIVSKSLDGMILSWNPAAEKLFGYTAEEMIGSPMIRLFPPDLLEQENSILQQIRKGERIDHFESVRVTKDGRHIDVSVTVSPLRDEDGSITGASTIVRDITQQKHATAQLNDFKAALDEHALVSITDVNGVITYANDKFCTVAKYSRDELIGEDHRIVNSQYHPRSFIRDLWDTIKSGRVWKGELRNRAKDGSLYWVATTIVPFLDDDKKPYQYIAIRTDISQRIETEGKLEIARAQADAANAAKSGFLANMSHEIRTPMNGVIGTVDVLRQTSLRPYQVELVEIIRESSYTLLGIIDGILDFSKIEAGRMELEHEPVSLALAVETVCEGLNPVAVRNRVDLTFYTDPALPLRVYSDAVRLRQVLNNLVGNAIKFSSRQSQPGRVRVRAEVTDERSVRLTVSDNGIGMTEETVEKLFKPFTQADTSTTRSFGGTGLGLSICKQLVTLFGGTIQVESVLGQGTVFIVDLPIEKAPVPGSDSVDLDVPGLECVLVAPDWEVENDWRSYLEDAGARVSAAPSLDAAAEQISERNSSEVTVVISENHHSFGHDSLRQPFDGVSSPIRHLVLVRRRHRRPHSEAEDIYVVDGDAMRRSTFLQAVSYCAGRTELVPDEVEASFSEDVLVPNIEEAAAQGRLVLVAEDNETNQMVIRHQLALLGYACEVAGNGLEALELWRSGRHALLLSDLHMPGLDGRALASRIRAEEDESTHLPIIAFTANITKGERERCRAAGMDDYLSKPAQLDAFRAMLDKWLDAANSSSSLMTAEDDEAVPAPGEAPVFDTAVLPQMVSTTDSGTLIGFLNDYLQSVSHAKAEIQTAAAQEDWSTVADVAHRLRSSSKLVGALALAEVCEAMQRVGAGDDTTQLVGLVTRFDQESTAAIAAIEASKEVWESSNGH